MGRTASTKNATLCGDRACRVRKMQARVRFVRCARPSAEIVRVKRSRTCRTKVFLRVRETYRERHIHTQRPTHCLNTLDLRLHTEHLTHNSHSNFTRGEKCFRATRRLVFFRDPCTPALRWVRPLQAGTAHGFSPKNSQRCKTGPHA